jgi:hypothetical protein
LGERRTAIALAAIAVCRVGVVDDSFFRLIASPIARG